MRRELKGFTLIEIMIVVLIIGILLAIAVPNWVTSRTTSQTNSCIANLKKIDESKEQWGMDLNKAQGSLPVWADLAPNYIRSQPACQASGIYTIAPLGTLPSCTVAGHVLP